MKLLILIVCLSALYFTKDVKSFGIRPNGLSEETKNFGRGPVQTLEAMLERDLGPLDILERYCKEFISNHYPFFLYIQKKVLDDTK